MNETTPANPTPSASHWRNARATDVAGRASIQYSLAFHHLQEARQELHLARLHSSALSPREGERLIAYCEANLAMAEEWIARTLEPKAAILPKDRDPDPGSRGSSAP